MFADRDTRATIADFSCGAVQRGAFRLLDAAPFGVPATARCIATCLTDDAVALNEFRFMTGECIAIGNEYDGLPSFYVAAADVRLRIPMADVWTPKPPSRAPIDPTRAPGDQADGVPVLSAAMSAGIIAYSAFIQCRARRSA